MDVVLFHVSIWGLHVKKNSNCISRSECKTFYILKSTSQMQNRSIFALVTVGCLSSNWHQKSIVYFAKPYSDMRFKMLSFRMCRRGRIQDVNLHIVAALDYGLVDQNGCVSEIPVKIIVGLIDARRKQKLTFRRLLDYWLCRLVVFILLLSYFVLLCSYWVVMLFLSVNGFDHLIFLTFIFNIVFG